MAINTLAALITGLYFGGQRSQQACSEAICIDAGAMKSLHCGCVQSRASLDPRMRMLCHVLLVHLMPMNVVSHRTHKTRLVSCLLCLHVPLC